MESLEQTAHKHFEKLNKTIEYHAGRLKGDLPVPIKNVIQSEIDMLEFMAEYAKEALVQRGIRV